MVDDHQKRTEENAAFELGASVEYADGKRGVVIGYVPAVPETDSAYEKDLWRELINRAVSDDHDEISLSGPIADPQYVGKRETGVTTVFGADELTERPAEDKVEDFGIDDDLE